MPAKNENAASRHSKVVMLTHTHTHTDALKPLPLLLSWLITNKMRHYNPKESKTTKFTMNN